jgi:hypothetical protein
MKELKDKEKMPKRIVPTGCWIFKGRISSVTSIISNQKF